MASVDEIFKKSGIPSKRKLEGIRDPNEIYKAAKLSSKDSSSRSGGRLQRATVEDEDEQPADHDGDYRPSLPPENPDEDKEGRFFGSGMTSTEAAMLDMVDDLAASGPSTGEGGTATAADETIDLPWLRRTAQQLSRLATRNAELRAKYPTEPQKFIASEADLDSAIRGLSVLASYPNLYPDFVSLGCASQLVGLLAHENGDIAVAALTCISELTDEDVGGEEGEWEALVDGLVEADVVGLVRSNLERLGAGEGGGGVVVDEDGDEVKREGGDEGDEMDRQGVYHALSIVENLCSRPATAEVLGADEALVRWILARAARKEEGDGVSQNKQYAAEVFAILAQASPVNRKRLAELEGAIDTLLQLAAPYRRRDPSDLLGGEEEEYLADVFEALTCLVDEPVGKIEFVKAEGVELCLLMLRDLGKSSHKNKADKSGKAAAKASKEKVNPCGPLALRLLDHATSGISPEASDACVRLVGEAAGLGTLGSLLMRTRDADRARMEPLANILSSLLRLLPPESDERIRAVGKLCEKDHEKLRKLVGARAVYARRVEAVDARARQERNGEDEEDEEARREREIEAVGRRLDAGLYLVQTIDSILAWVVAEDPSAKKGVVEALKSVGESLADVRQSMQDQIAELDEETEEGRYYKEMLTTLLDFVK